MNMRDLDKAVKQIQRKFPRLVVKAGNLGEEVVIYIRYQAGSLYDYKDFPDEYNGIKIVKDGREPFVPK